MRCLGYTESLLDQLINAKPEMDAILKIRCYSDETLRKSNRNYEARWFGWLQIAQNLLQIQTFTLDELLIKLLKE
jgi:hypothetical protein